MRGTGTVVVHHVAWLGLVRTFMLNNQVRTGKRFDGCGLPPYIPLPPTQYKVGIIEGVFARHFLLASQANHIVGDGKQTIDVMWPKVVKIDIGRYGNRVKTNFLDQAVNGFSYP